MFEISGLTFLWLDHIISNRRGSGSAKSLVGGVLISNLHFSKAALIWDLGTTSHARISQSVVFIQIKNIPRESQRRVPDQKAMNPDIFDGTKYH